MGEDRCEAHILHITLTVRHLFHVPGALLGSLCFKDNGIRQLVWSIVEQEVDQLVGEAV